MVRGGGTFDGREGGAVGVNGPGCWNTHVVKVCVRGAMVRGAVVCRTSGCVIIT